MFLARARPPAARASSPREITLHLDYSQQAAFLWIIVSQQIKPSQHVFVKPHRFQAFAEKKVKQHLTQVLLKLKKRTFIPSFIYLFLIFLILTAYVFRDVSN